MDPEIIYILIPHTITIIFYFSCRIQPDLRKL